MPKAKKPRLRVLPHYQARVRLHLPADPGWRQMARGKDLQLLAMNPQDLFTEVIKAVIRSLCEGMEEKDANAMTFGLLLNLVQAFPLEVRQSLVAAIREGLMLVTLLDADGNLVVDLSREVDAFNEETGERRTASGIIIPGSV